MARIIVRDSATGGKRYTAQIRFRGTSESKTFSTKTGAKQWAQQRESTLRDDPHSAGASGSAYSVDDAIRRCIDDHLSKKRPNTQRTVAMHLRYWSERIGRLKLDEISPRLLAELRDELARSTTRRRTPMTATTVNRRMTALSLVLSLAHRRWFWLGSNPFDKYEALAEGPSRVRFLSDDEIFRLIDACRASSNPHLYLAVMVALTSGGRYSEVMGLRWDDIDFAAGSATFRETKNGSTRSIGLTDEVLDMLRVRRGDADAFVFPSTRKAGRPAAIKNAWSKAIEAAGIGDFKFHDLRHSAASYLAMSGASLPEIAAVLGHKKLDMVQRYAHLSPEHVATASRAIGAKVSGVLANG